MQPAWYLRKPSRVDSLVIEIAVTIELRAEGIRFISLSHESDTLQGMASGIDQVDSAVIGPVLSRLT